MGGQLTVQFALHPLDIANVDKISDIELEYALVPKAKTMEFAKNKLLKKMDDIDPIDIENLKWIQTKKSIQYNVKKQKKNVHKIEELKSFRAYLIRIRAQNESGWGPFSKILPVVTKECLQVLKFSKTYKSPDGLVLSDHRRAVKRISTGHKYILADTKPVKKGKHCWRVKVKDNKHWIFFGVAEQKHHSQNNYSQSYGCSGSTQFYKNGNGQVQVNNINTKHLHTAQFVDILLNIDKGTLNICEVGNCNSATEAKLWNLPKTHGYVPSFNIHGTGIEIRLAKITPSWYGKKKKIKFN